MNLDIEQNSNSQAFNILSSNRFGQVKNNVEKIFSEPTAKIFLDTLLLNDYQKINIYYQEYSYLYKCRILTQINEMSNGNADEATMFKTILEQLAYRMYNKNRELDLEESFVLDLISDYNQEYRGNKISDISVIKKLIEYKILETQNKKYSFKHNYMYYYFIGSFIKTQLSPIKKQEIIETIFSDFSKEINFKIALFLVQDMNIEFEVLPQIQNVSQKLLSQYDNFKYNYQNKFIKEMHDNVNIKVNSRFYIDKNKDLKEILLEISQMIKVIEFLNYILKNYSSSIKRQVKIEIINLMHKSGLKLIGTLYSLMSEISIENIE